MAKPYGYRRVMIGQGAAVDPKTIEGAGTTGQALRIATTGDEPTFGTLDAATVLGSTKVPAANGGTGLDTSASTGVAQVAAGTWSVSAVDLATADVTGVLPVANGGTGQAVGAIAIMQFWGTTVVSAGATVLLGREWSATATDVHFRVPVTGTVIGMNTTASAGPGGVDTFTYRARISGTAEAASEIIVTGAGVSGTADFSVAVARHDTISVRLVGSATAAIAHHMVTLAIRVDG